MGDTSIQWTDTTWNPTRGCSRVSPGCDNCYAMGQAHRFSGKPGSPYHGLTTIRRGKVDWSGRVRLVPEMLDAPLRWRRPRRIFVNSMSDLFHESIDDGDIAQVFAVMAKAERHTFQVLTKRAKRMREWFEWFEWVDGLGLSPDGRAKERGAKHIGGAEHPWPLQNVWLGVSAEDQQRADERIPDLLATPAAVRFVSAEPLIGPIDLRQTFQRDLGDAYPDVCDSRASFADLLDWVIVGGESGQRARPCDVAWIRSIVEQCRAAGVPAFVKQLGANIEHVGSFNPEPLRYERVDPDGCAHLHRIHLSDCKGGNPEEWPTDLRVREFPEVHP